MKYKLSEKAKLPTLKYYPNRKTNNDKMQKSFEIYIKKHTSVDADGSRSATLGAGAIDLRAAKSPEGMLRDERPRMGPATNE